MKSAFLRRQLISLIRQSCRAHVTLSSSRSISGWKYFTAMSWMDSWSRPSKRSAVPPPLYLTVGEDVPYCHTCGRVMTTRKSHKKTDNVIKYCSDRCRSRKPGQVDRKIEQKIVALLNGEPDSGVEKTGAKDRTVKGDHRVIVTCNEVEELVYGSRFDPEKVYGRRKNRASRAIGGKNEEWKSVDMVDTESSLDEAEPPIVQESSNTHVRPPQTESDINFSVGGERGWAEKVEENSVDRDKRREGQKKAEEREMIRRAMRRGIVFGFVVEEQPIEARDGFKPSKRRGSPSDKSDVDQMPLRKKCEALMNGSIVDPSFAKGNWSIRWRGD